MTEQRGIEQDQQPVDLAASLKFYRETLASEYALDSSRAYLDAFHQLIVIVQQAGVTGHQESVDIALRALPHEYDRLHYPDLWRDELLAAPLELSKCGYLNWCELDAPALCEVFSLVDTEAHRHDPEEGESYCDGGERCPKAVLKEAATLQLWILEAEQAVLEQEQEDELEALWHRHQFIYRALVAKEVFTPLELKLLEGDIQNDLMRVFDSASYAE